MLLLCILRDKNRRHRGRVVVEFDLADNVFPLLYYDLLFPLGLVFLDLLRRHFYLVFSL